MHLKRALAILSLSALASLFFVTAVSAPVGHLKRGSGNSIRKIVDAAIRPLLSKDHIPGQCLSLNFDFRL